MDPYKVLGVSRNATDEEIKKAYRELARKYHPDNFQDATAEELAEEKMKEINEAYDILTKAKGSSSGGQSAYSSQQGSSEFARVRAAISSNDLYTAEQLLNASNNRNAEWNYLMGSLYYRKGWLDAAQNYFQTAVNMDPGNQEYRQALNYMRGGANAYRSYNGGSMSNMDPLDCCTALACANCLCGGCR